MTDLQIRVRDYLVREAKLPADQITEDTPLITSSLVDSFLVVSLVAFLESEAGVRIPDDYVTPDHLDSLNRMQALVDRCR